MILYTKKLTFCLSPFHHIVLSQFLNSEQNENLKYWRENIFSDYNEVCLAASVHIILDDHSGDSPAAKPVQLLHRHN